MAVVAVGALWWAVLPEPLTDEERPYVGDWWATSSTSADLRLRLDESRRATLTAGGEPAFGTGRLKMTWSVAGGRLRVRTHDRVLRNPFRLRPRQGVDRPFRFSGETYVVEPDGSPDGPVVLKLLPRARTMTFERDRSDGRVR